MKKWLRLETHHPKLGSASETIYQVCSEIAKTPASGKTVVLYGDNGCGKTHLAKAIARWCKGVKMLLPLVIDRSENGSVTPVECLYVSWAEIVDGFKPPRNEYQIVEDLQNCTVLVVDDIGAEYDPSKLGVEKLYTMLNRREFKWNIFTTNFAPDEWEQRFDAKISSRLFRNALHVNLIGVPDYSTL